MSAWLRRFKPTADAPVRLYCFPHAGGSASYFAPMARALAPSIDVVAVQYPARQDRRAEPAIPSIVSLARGVAPEISTDRPFAFFGHSMGATVAFEAARLVSPVELFVSGRRGPTTYRGESLHRQGDEALMRELKSLGGTDLAALDDEIMEMVLPALRADYQAVETYRFEPGPLLSCPITALIGDADPKVSLEEARDWAAHTTGRFEIEVFPGGHFYLADQAAAVNAALVRRLTPGLPRTAATPGT